MSASASASTGPSLPGKARPDGGQAVGGAVAHGSMDARQALAAYLSALLERLCELSEGQAAAAFVRLEAQRAPQLAALYVRPGHERLGERLGREASVVGRLAGLAERCVRQAEAADGASDGARGPSQGLAFGVLGEHVVLGGGDLYHAQPTHRALAVPLVALGRGEGACVVLVPVGVSVSAAVERSLRLACDGFEGFLWSRRALAEAERAVQLRETLELLDAAQRGANAATMAGLFCDELRRRFGCTRVSVGLVHGQGVRAVAISGADTIDRRNPAVEAIESAMDECADQDIEVVYPQPDDLAPAERRVVRAHDELSRRFGPSSIVSLPLRVDGDLVGVVLLERSAEDPFPPGSLGLLRLTAEFIGPAVWLRRLADRGVLAVARDRVAELGAALVGPRHTLAKLVAVLALLVFIALAATPVPSVVAAAGEVRPAQMRAVSPPFQGYLSWVGVKPGDAVRAGQVIARMDTTDRQARLAQLDAQYAAQRAQRESELARGRMDQAEVLAQRMAEIDAQRSLLREEIERASIRAPIDGRISGSDLEPWLDALVSPETPLVRIVGERGLVVLRVPERDLAAVQRRFEPAEASGPAEASPPAGSSQDGGAAAADGTFAARARPQDRLAIRLVRVHPQAEAVAGGNVYLVEAEVLGPWPAWLQPGMTGRGRVRAGWTTPLARLVRPLVDRAQMAWWW